MSRARQVGTGWESAVREYLAANGHPDVERLALGGVRDRGDLTGIRKWFIECKATTRIDLGDFMTVAERKARRIGRQPVLFIKRRNRRVGDGYAVMPISVWAQLVAERSGD